MLLLTEAGFMDHFPRDIGCPFLVSAECKLRETNRAVLPQKKLTREFLKSLKVNEPDIYALWPYHQPPKAPKSKPVVSSSASDSDGPGPSSKSARRPRRKARKPRSKSRSPTQRASTPTDAQSSQPASSKAPAATSSSVANHPTPAAAPKTPQAPKTATAVAAASPAEMPSRPLRMSTRARHLLSSPRRCNSPPATSRRPPKRPTLNRPPQIPKVIYFPRLCLTSATNSLNKPLMLFPCGPSSFSSKVCPRLAYTYSLSAPSLRSYPSDLANFRFSRGCP